jgi:hypothetical protein
MVKIKMGGYVDDNGKIMTKEELNSWILEIQTENARLQKQISDMTTLWGEACAENIMLTEELNRDKTVPICPDTKGGE